MIDIVFPDKNEREFIKIAEKLGYDSLCFVYSLGKIPKSLPESDVGVCTAVVTDGKNVQKAKGKVDFVFVKASDNVRSQIEKKNIDLVFNLEQSDRKDFIHHRNSGLNQVLCNILKKKEALFGISFREILNSSYRSVLLGRIMQNITFSRKFGFDTCFASFAKSPYEMRAPSDIISFLSLVGFRKNEAKASLSSLERKI